MRRKRKEREGRMRGKDRFGRTGETGKTKRKVSERK